MTKLDRKLEKWCEYFTKRINTDHQKLVILLTKELQTTKIQWNFCQSMDTRSILNTSNIQYDRGSGNGQWIMLVMPFGNGNLVVAFIFLKNVHLL
jgi:hypothetical protein